jgi:hypothetical protein
MRVTDLQEKAVKLLALVRSALLYLAFSIRVEEVQRTRARSDQVVVPPNPLQRWDDGWKCPM